MKDGIQDELELAASRSQDGIVSAAAPYERGSCLGVDGEDGERQSHRQSGRKNSDRVGRPVTLDTTPNEMKE